MPGAILKKGNKLTKEDLNSEDIYVFDGGDCIFTWVGSKATKHERKEALLKALHYLHAHKLPAETTVIRVVEGKETDKFWKVFNAQA